MTFATPLLRLTESQYRQIVAHCFDAERDRTGLLFEACGLLVGPVATDGQPVGRVSAVYLCRNIDASAKTYTVDPRDLLRAMRDADDRGEAVIGVWHSHTHTRAYPSETDIRQAPDPTWIYPIVSLATDDAPVLRAYRIRDGEVGEVAVALDRG